MIDSKYNILSTGFFSGRCASNDFSYDEKKEKGIKYYSWIPGAFLNFIGKAKSVKTVSGKTIYVNKKSYANLSKNHELKGLYVLKSNLIEWEKSIPKEYRGRCKKLFKEALKYLNNQKEHLNDIYFDFRETDYNHELSNAINETIEILRPALNMKIKNNQTIKLSQAEFDFKEKYIMRMNSIADGVFKK